MQSNKRLSENNKIAIWVAFICIASFGLHCFIFGFPHATKKTFLLVFYAVSYILSFSVFFCFLSSVNTYKRLLLICIVTPLACSFIVYAGQQAFFVASGGRWLGLLNVTIPYLGLYWFAGVWAIGIPLFLICVFKLNSTTSH
jgi:hypothetical protein